MQKIKNEKGITMVALIVTVVVLMLVTGIAVSTGTSAIDEVRDNKLKAELQIVQQAILTEYAKAKELGLLNDEDYTNYPNNFVGEKLDGIPDAGLYENQWYFNLYSDSIVSAYKSYFVVSPEQLRLLGIEDATHTYIVNYYTGEVYNETKRETSQGEELYIVAKDGTTAEKEVGNFSDDE